MYYKTYYYKNVLTSLTVKQALQEFISRGCKYTEYEQDLDLESDFIIGALFPVHTLIGDKYLLDTQGVCWVESFLYAIDQINKNKTLLPGVRLGYDARDTCRDEQVAIQQTLDFLSDIKYYNYGNKSVVADSNNGTVDDYSSGAEAYMTCKCVREKSSRLIGVVGM